MNHPVPALLRSLTVRTPQRARIFPFWRVKPPLTGSCDGCAPLPAPCSWVDTRSPSLLPYTAPLFSEERRNFKHTGTDPGRNTALGSSLALASPGARSAGRFSRLHRPLRVCTTTSSQIPGKTAATAGLAALQGTEAHKQKVSARLLCFDSIWEGKYSKREVLPSFHIQVTSLPHPWLSPPRPHSKTPL